MTTHILKARPLGFPWETEDPFLFCVYHDDAYPKGNARLGPNASLAGRNIGQDFEGKDGFRMYHGTTVPGFPQHPHRGFETVTIVRKGLVDHSDSLGAAARYGAGDVQWLTAGKGIVHAEMFPLLERDKENPLELFQIWLNLPAEDKLVPPHFSMFWANEVPVHTFRDDAGKATIITTIAGKIGEKAPPAPPPHSWAARADTDIAIWTIRMEPGASFALPKAAHPNTKRTVYFFHGDRLRVGDQEINRHAALSLKADEEIPLWAGEMGCEMLMLQGRPIGQPVVQHGPFVMSTQEQIRQAFLDYQRTRFGGWPWPEDGPTHGPENKRFAKRPE